MEETDEDRDVSDGKHLDMQSGEEAYHKKLLLQIEESDEFNLVQLTSRRLNLNF